MIKVSFDVELQEPLWQANLVKSTKSSDLQDTLKWMKIRDKVIFLYYADLWAEFAYKLTQAYCIGVGNYIIAELGPFHWRISFDTRDESAILFDVNA